MPAGRLRWCSVVRCRRRRTICTPAIEQLLKSIRAADKGQLAVSEEDGRFLRVLVASTGAKRVLEIGAASGYSAIWMGLGAAGDRRPADDHRVRPGARQGGRRRTSAAPACRTSCSVIAGDAFKEIPKVPGTFDLVFLDAWKPDYKKFFDLVFPRVTPGGLFLAHNVINKKNEMLDFLRAIAAHPQALNTTVSPGHEGISMTYKKR